MISQFEMRLLKEVVSKKDVFLDFLDSPENLQKYREAVAIYKIIDKAHSDYISGVGNEALSRWAYSSALKEKKIDPYIAGGAAQAIGGIAPGVYTAVKASSHNAEIEARRHTYKTMALKDSSAREVAERTLRSSLYELDTLLNTEDTIKNYRESLLEMDYQTALKIKGNKDYENARNAFLSLGNYKDSALQAAACKNNNTVRSIGTIAVVSAVLSAVLSIFTVLVSGVFTAGIEATITVFIIAFIISEIILVIMFLRNNH